MIKVCTTCGIEKALRAFYKYGNGKHMAVCKECHCADVAENRRLKREHYCAYLKLYNQRPERRAKLAARKKSEAGKLTARIWYRFKKLAAAT